ncbi:MAG TPA: 3-deoxy-D-manno-octulosonic acid transferase [Terriglobales bacterium]|nr:3-deoxy-D-manno-octulosonic acid transferase [Terriglobales bacterium]
MYLIYSMVLGLGLAALTPWLLLRNPPDGRYTRYLGERFGRVGGVGGRGTIWLHAVSVGEALAVERLIAQLRQRFPARAVVLSVTTATGRSVAERRIEADRIFYFPLDFRFAARRALRAIQPELVLIAETEIWPNFLREAALQQVPVMFINGRISGRSYARYRMIRRLLRPTLGRVASFLMQTETDAERILDLGADAARVQVAGNLKFDLIPPEQPGFLRGLRERLAGAGVGQVVVAGSTMETEEEAVLAAYRQVLGQAAAPERLLLVVAPRHPQRFEQVAALLAGSGLRWARRSRLEEQELPAGGVLLLDSLGELASVYQVAATAFIGGSLAPHGGHNLLEPAYWGVPVVLGPHMENFAQIAEQFLAAGAALRVGSALELGHVWQQLLNDEAMRARVGGAARRLLESQRGATGRALEAIEAALRPMAAAERVDSEEWTGDGGPQKAGE